MSLTLGQLVILLQVAEPLFGGGDVVALVLRDVLLAGRFELLQVLVGDVFRQVAEQRAVLRHGLVRGRRKRKKKGWNRNYVFKVATMAARKNKIYGDERTSFLNYLNLILLCAAAASSPPTSQTPQWKTARKT